MVLLLNERFGRKFPGHCRREAAFRGRPMQRKKAPASAGAFLDAVYDSR
jgi:hypothetical protein